MVINPERWANELANWFAELRYRVCADNKLGRTDLNKMCESMFIPILNRIYGWNLVNANETVANEPGIDLKDWQRNVVVQVTSDRSLEKVRSTIALTAQRHQGSELFMFYIGMNPPKTWNDQTFKTPTANYQYPTGKIGFSCSSSIITLDDLQRKCANDPVMLRDVHAICQCYFGDVGTHIQERKTDAYDAALKSLAPLVELWGHVDLVKSYCKAYCDENDVYRWSSIRSIMGNQVTLYLTALANVFITLRECLFSEADASEAITELELQVSALMSCADALQRLPLRDTDQYSQKENDAILKSVKSSSDALNKFQSCSEQLIRLIVGRTTNPSGSAALLQSWT